jgi:RHS repeat-associated protein
MRLGNGRWEHTNFNNRLQPTEIGLGSSGVDSSLLKLDYEYGTTANNGNVLKQIITVPTIGTATGFTATQHYQYDQLNRLTGAQEVSGTSSNWQTTGTVWQQKFSYDRYGNRTVDTANTTSTMIGPNPQVSTSNNRIVPRTSPLEYYEFDNDGNMKKGQSGDVLAYDAENRLVQYQGGASQSGGADYFYDADGKRVKKIQPSGTLIFVYNIGGQLVAEYTTSITENNGTSYLTSDMLRSPRALTKADGSIRARNDYLPFGEELPTDMGGRTIDQGYLLLESVRQRYTGAERDDETGQDFMQARYYSPTLGRFTRPDDFWNDSDIADPQSWNKYAYVRNNPLRYVDPTGEKAEVTIRTDEKNKTGTVTIKASISIYSKGITKEQLNQAKDAIETSIESAWSGSFEKDGIVYTVTTDVTVEAHDSETAATNSGAQNVFGISAGDSIPGRAVSHVDERGWFSGKSGPDTGTWKFDRVANGGQAGHEFTHLLGADNSSNRANVSFSPNFFDSESVATYGRATSFDFHRALGDAIYDHRVQSRQFKGDGNSVETKSSPGFRLGPYESRTSTRILVSR